MPVLIHHRVKYALTLRTYRSAPHYIINVRNVYLMQTCDSFAKGVLTYLVRVALLQGNLHLNFQNGQSGIC
jgi:hypothetical protein